MRNLWFAFWEGFRDIFRNPQEIHRVLVVIPISIYISHSIYMYNSRPVDYIVNVSDRTDSYLGWFMVATLTLWCFFSNEMSIDLFNRFAIVATLSGLFHRIFFYAIELGDPYFVTMAVVSFLIFGLWAVTGKNYKEFKASYIRPALTIFQGWFIKNEKKGKLYPINDRDNAVNE